MYLCLSGRFYSENCFIVFCNNLTCCLQNAHKYRVLAPYSQVVLESVTGFHLDFDTLSEVIYEIPQRSPKTLNNSFSVRLIESSGTVRLT